MINNSRGDMFRAIIRVNALAEIDIFQTGIFRKCLFLKITLVLLVLEHHKSVDL